MLINTLKTFNSVKIGATEKTYFAYPEFSMELVDQLLYIKDKCGNEVITPITNTPWFTRLIESPKSETVKVSDEQGKSVTNIEGTRKAKAKKA